MSFISPIMDTEPGVISRYSFIYSSPANESLAGDDEEKMKTMKEAVEKGFKEATKSWGRTLPDISQDTYSAVMDKFDKYFASKNTDSTNA